MLYSVLFELHCLGDGLGYGIDDVAVVSSWLTIVMSWLCAAGS